MHIEQKRIPNDVVELIHNLGKFLYNQHTLTLAEMKETFKVMQSDNLIAYHYVLSSEYSEHVMEIKDDLNEEYGSYIVRNIET